MALASFIIDVHSSLSNAFVLNRFTPSLFIHLSLGRPLPLRPSYFPSKIFFTDLVSFILTTCPSHSNLRIFIMLTISGVLYLVTNSSFVLILHRPLSFVGPYIFLNIFLSHVINIFSLLLVIDNQLDATIIVLLTISIGPTCFGQLFAHLHER